jgi:hypothetical protein
MINEILQWGAILITFAAILVFNRNFVKLGEIFNWQRETMEEIRNNIAQVISDMNDPDKP